MCPGNMSAAEVLPSVGNMSAADSAEVLPSVGNMSAAEVLPSLGNMSAAEVLPSPDKTIKTLGPLIISLLS